LPDGAERQVCAELADKDAGYMALLEAELGLLAIPRTERPPLPHCFHSP